MERDGDRMVVAFPEHHGFARQTFEQRDNLKILSDVCREATGDGVKVHLVEEAETSRDLASPAETNPAAARRDRLIDSAMHEPAVRTLIDAFQGEILDVRESEGSE